MLGDLSVLLICQVVYPAPWLVVDEPSQSTGQSAFRQVVNSFKVRTGFRLLRIQDRHAFLLEQSHYKIRLLLQQIGKLSR